MEQSQINQQSTAKSFQIQPQDKVFMDEVQSVIAEFSEAFSKGDANRVASFFAPDATLINPAGVRAQGRGAILQVAQNDMNTFLKGSRIEFKYESSRMLTDDLALLDLNQTVTEIKTADGRAGSSMNIHVAIVAKKIGDRWMWLDARPYTFMQAPRNSIH